MFHRRRLAAISLAGLLSLSVALNVALFCLGHLRTDQRAALAASLARRVHNSGPTIILGDSIVADLAVPADRAVNLAVPGATVEWIAKHQLDIVASLRPNRILLAAGVNDLRSGATPEETAQALLALAVDLEASSPGAQTIVLCILPLARVTNLADSVKPADIILVNRLLLEGAASRGLRAIDYSTMLANAEGMHDQLTHDGLHPNSGGQAILNDLFFNGLAGRPVEKTDR